MRILLVEDEKAIREAVAAYLEREGYWVTGAVDGQAALDQFAKHRFDLVVLDLMLPKVSGEQVCRAIRDASDVPIIILTARREEIAPGLLTLFIQRTSWLFYRHIEDKYPKM